MTSAADTEQTEIAVQRRPRPQAVLAKLSLILGALTLIAALFMPAMVAWDDARALAKYEESHKGEPMKIFGVTVGGGEFVPPSERGIMGSCVMLFMIGLTLTGLAAVILGVAAVSSPTLRPSVLGALSGGGGVILAAYLSPMGLAVLVLIAAGFVIAGLFSGFTAFSGFGGGC